MSTFTLHLNPDGSIGLGRINVPGPNRPLLDGEDIIGLDIQLKEKAKRSNPEPEPKEELRS